MPPKATGEELLELIDQAVKNTQEQSRPRSSFSQEDAAKPRLSLSHGDKSVVKLKPKPSSGHWFFFNQSFNFFIEIIAIQYLQFSTI